MEENTNAKKKKMPFDETELKHKLKSIKTMMDEELNDICDELSREEGGEKPDD